MNFLSLTIKFNNKKFIKFFIFFLHGLKNSIGLFFLGFVLGGVSLLLSNNKVLGKTTTTFVTPQQKNTQNTKIIGDPFESINRTVFTFNQWLDFGYLSFFYKTYDHIPYVVKTSFSHFLLYCNFPINFLNSLLQGRLQSAFRHTQRFIINTIFGLGFFDVASSVFGLQEKPTGFAQTLKTWGYDHHRDYMVIPFLGPCTGLDLFGKVMDFAFQPLTFFLYPGVVYYTLYYIDTKVPLEKLLRSFSYSQDPYTSLRKFYEDLSFRM